MIKRLVIHRFRGIRQGTLEDFGKINVLIGPNNSGKSAVLEMLYLAGVAGRECEVLIPDVEPSAWKATTPNKRDFLGYRPLGRLRRRHGEPAKWRDTPAEQTQENVIDIKIDSNELPKNYPLHRFILSTPPEWEKAENFFEKDDKFYISLFRLSPRASISIPEPMIPPFFNKKQVTLENAYWIYLWEKSWIYQWRKKEPIDHFAVWAIEDRIPNSQNVLFFDFHTSVQHLKKTFTQREKDAIPDWHKKISESFGRIFPEVKNAVVEIDDVHGSRFGEKTGYIHFLGKTRIPIDHFGDGARHTFKVLAALIALRERVGREGKPGLFLWEDPELFMHPRSLNKLLKEMLSLVKDKPIQVFLSSQSIELIAILTAQIQNFALQSEYRIFRLDLKQGQLYVAKYLYDNVLAWLKSGMDLRFWNVESLPISYNFIAEASTEGN